MSLFDKKQEEATTVRGIVKALQLVQLAPIVLGKPTTISVMILDASGSMAVHGTAPQDAVNNHLTTVARDFARDHYVSVVCFSDAPSIAIPITLARRLPQMKDYQADGSTLQWYTVDLVLHQLLELWYKISEEIRKNLHVVIGVFSDGQDNKSDRNLYPRQLQDRSKHARQLGWELYAFGLGIDGIRLAAEMGFIDDSSVRDVHAQTVAPTKAGIDAATDAFTQIIRR
jgi:hypothetical protein